MNKREIDLGILYVLNQYSKIEITGLLDECFNFFEQKVEKEQLLQRISTIINNPEIANDYYSIFDLIVHKSAIFSNAKIRISLTEQEYNSGVLYIGHRFILYLPINTDYKLIKLFDNKNKPLQQIIKRCDIFESRHFFSLADTTTLGENFKFHGETVDLIGYDINTWLRETNFQLKDQIEITFLDYPELKMGIKHIPAKEIATQFFIQKANEDKLEEFIIAVMENKSTTPLWQTLFRAFVLGYPDLPKSFAAPVTRFITNNENFEINHSGTLATITSKHNAAINQTKKKQNLMSGKINHGKAKTIEGIFKEMDIHFTKAFVKGLIILQLQTNGNCDKNKISDILFVNNKKPFYNDRQETNFNAALDKLTETTAKGWNKVNFEPQQLKLLSELIDFNINVNNFVQDLKQRYVDFDIDTQPYITIQSFDNISYQLLQLLVTHKVQMYPTQLKEIRDNVDFMRERFEEVKESINDYKQNNE